MPRNSVEQWEADAQRALTTGLVAGTLMKACLDPNHPLHGYSVDVTVDGEGNYTRCIEVISPSGRIYTLTVFEEWNIREDLENP